MLRNSNESTTTLGLTCTKSSNTFSMDVPAKVMALVRRGEGGLAVCSLLIREEMSAGKL